MQANVDILWSVHCCGQAGTRAGRKAAGGLHVQPLGVGVEPSTASATWAVNHAPRQGPEAYAGSHRCKQKRKG